MFPQIITGSLAAALLSGASFMPLTPEAATPAAPTTPVALSTTVSAVYSATSEEVASFYHLLEKLAQKPAPQVVRPPAPASRTVTRPRLAAPAPAEGAGRPEGTSALHGR